MVLSSGDNITFNKAGFKSALLNAGDKVRIGKDYIRRGCPSLAVGDRVLVDNLGIRKSAWGFKYNYYRGFGGGDDFLYTIWSGNNGIYPIKYGWTIEKRYVPTLEIIKSVSLAALPGWSNSVYYHDISGSGQFFYHLSADNTEVRKYDSNNNYALISSNFLETFTPTTTPASSGWPADVDLVSTNWTFGMAENIITAYAIRGPPVGYPPYPFFSFIKWSADTGALIDHGEYDIPWRDSWVFYDYEQYPGISGLASDVYARTSGDVMSHFAFVSDGRTKTTGDAVAGQFYMTDDIGFSEVVPSAIGNNTCTGYSWDPATLTRTAI